MFVDAHPPRTKPQSHEVDKLKDLLLSSPVKKPSSSPMETKIKRKTRSSKTSKTPHHRTKRPKESQEDELISDDTQSIDEDMEQWEIEKQAPKLKKNQHQKKKKKKLPKQPTSNPSNDTTNVLSTEPRMNPSVVAPWMNPVSTASNLLPYSGLQQIPIPSSSSPSSVTVVPIILPMMFPFNVPK